MSAPGHTMNGGAMGAGGAIGTVGPVPMMGAVGTVGQPVDIGTLVRYWLHYSTMASSFFKQFNGAQKIRDDYQQQLIAHLKQKKMENAVIQISGGRRLQVVERKEPNPLSLTQIESLLHGYYKQRTGKDETADIMTFIRGNRGYKHTKTIRQSGPAST
jgi:hypothetical protein